jgi:hypothetical protein
MHKTEEELEEDCDSYHEDGGGNVYEEVELAMGA